MIPRGREGCLTRICAMMKISNITAFSRPLSIFGTETIAVVSESSIIESLEGGREKTSLAGIRVGRTILTTLREGQFKLRKGINRSYFVPKRRSSRRF